MPYFAGETDGGNVSEQVGACSGRQPIQSSINRIALFQFLVILYCMVKPTPGRPMVRSATTE